MLTDGTTVRTEWPTSMAAVAECVRTLDRERRIDEVAARLREIARERGPLRPRLGRRPDGVACFNYMYLCVTERVRDSLADFEDPLVVERLAVVFAEFYLLAYDAACAGAWVSKAWQPLFEATGRRGIAPIPYALAGMNAHINNDLAWALLQTWRELGYAQAPDSPVYRDFERIDEILEEVAVEV